MAADLPTKAPLSTGCNKAVDGLNGKAAGIGGSYSDKGVYGALGSISMPLGCEYGFQVDAVGASFDGRFLGAAAGHLFWRDPSKALLGVYGSYTYWDQVGGVRIAHIGPEAELYMGRWTLQAVSGVEFGNNASGVVDGSTVTYNIDTRFFDEVNLAYYPLDDLKLYIGHRYLSGKNSLALGSEYGISTGHGTMTALFAEGRIGENNNNNGIFGGIRLYFGQHDKTLIRRHREDDPTDWNLGIDGTSNSGTSTAIPTVTAPSEGRPI